MLRSSHWGVCVCALSLAVCSKTSHLLEICRNKKNESRFLFLVNLRRFHSDSHARARRFFFLQLSVKGICIKEGFFWGGSGGSYRFNSVPCTHALTGGHAHVRSEGTSITLTWPPLVSFLLQTAELRSVEVGPPPKKTLFIPLWRRAPLLPNGRYFYQAPLMCANKFHWEMSPGLSTPLLHVLPKNTLIDVNVIKPRLKCNTDTRHKYLFLCLVLWLARRAANSMNNEKNDTLRWNEDFGLDHSCFICSLISP